MIARNRIWEELKQAKANILGLQKYTDKQRSYNRWYNGILAFTASVGALGYSINEIIPFITSIIIGITSIAKSILPNFLQSAQDLSELDVLSDFYVRYMNSLEKIWYDNENNYADEKETMDRFFELKETECDKESAYNLSLIHI